MQASSECPQCTLPRIAVDVMGSDLGPQQITAGVELALKQSKVGRIGKLFLVGDENVLSPLSNGIIRAGNGLDIEIVHTPNFVKMDEKPISALKHKKDASMFVGMELVKEKKADALLSCGNTGCLMACSTLKLRTIPGVVRPALASIIPTRTHFFILMDVGANPAASVECLVHNAILGSHFAKAVLRLPNPRIGLLTIGTEEGKGNELINQTHQILKQLDGDSLNYKGPIEGFDLFKNSVDVAICDGFVGNILLKTCESLFTELKNFIKDEFNRNCIRKTGAILSRGVFSRMRSQFSPDQFSGAPLLGLNGWVFKAHGSSKAEAIAGALNMCLNCLEVYDFRVIESDIAKANALLRSTED